MIDGTFSVNTTICYSPTDAYTWQYQIGTLKSQLCDTIVQITPLDYVLYNYGT
jgi:hypothetical protein